MSLRRRGPNEDGDFLTAEDRTEAAAAEGLPISGFAIAAAALLVAYLLLSSVLSSGPVKLAAAATSCPNPGYNATLLSPAVPGSSATYTYLIDGCQPDDVDKSRTGVQWEDVDFVKFSGCWRVEDVKSTYASDGTVEFFGTDYVVVKGLSDADMPLTVEITFHFPLESGPKRTWIWVHAGPHDHDGWTYRVGGPFCLEKTPTPKPSPTPTPPPTPTKPPTATPTKAPTPTPSPTPTKPSTPTPTKPATPTITKQPQVTPTKTPVPGTDLAITKTDSPDPVAIGGTLAYAVTVTNVGAIAAENVVVTDELPDGVSLISSTPSQGSCEGTTCQLGTLTGGASAEISYVVIVDDDAESPLTNTACVETSSDETDTTNNCDEEDTGLKIPAGATSTPDDVPTMGGPGNGGGPGLPLLLLIGAALAIIGGAAAIAARRHATTS